MTRRVNGIAWLAAIAALCLLAVLPVSAFGTRARTATLELPVAGDASDDLDDDVPHARAASAAVEARPVLPVRPPPVPRRIVTIETVCGDTIRPEPPIERSVLPWLHQARLSVRRLI